MRKELANKEGERKSFHATFDRFGSKRGYQGYKEETILLKNIVDVETNKVVAIMPGLISLRAFSVSN